MRRLRAPFLMAMLNTILGTKKEMSQTFVQGYRVPVTKVLAGPCVVTQIKKMDKDGYWAVQIGFGSRRIKNTTKALQGHLKGAIKENKAPRFLAEVRMTEEPKLNVGEEIKISDVFRAGDVVSVVGISKGKGFAGAVKRHHFSGGPRTHGQSDRERAPGSIGQGTTPGRVYKGKRMAGRMGSDQVTVKNLHIISINPEMNELLVSGAIPGTKGSLVTIERLSSGSLADLEHETVTQTVVEGEPIAGAEGNGEQAEAGAEASQDVAKPVEKPASEPQKEETK